MPGFVRPKPTGRLPRIISPTLMWMGGCLYGTYNGERVHGHFSAYVILGSEKTMMVDTGHPMHWATLEPEVEAFLDGRPLDYIFPTHAEFPHAGLLGDWMAKYPDAIAVGDVRDYHFYYPQFSARLVQKQVGDRISLGDREFQFVPAVWRDMPSTLWGFDTGERVLFVADAFAYLHYHKLGCCDLIASEQPPPDIPMMQFFTERSLQWTRFTDSAVTFDDMDLLLDTLKPAMIAPGHGGIIDTQEVMLPLAKTVMSTMPPPQIG